MSHLFHTQSKRKTIILIDISAENYSFKEIYHRIVEFVSVCQCPCCRTIGQFKRHAWYEKYHYKRSILIVRVRCSGCGKTHAVLPSFSLPGTSVGTEEVERYLEDRYNGMGRGKAAKIFVGLGVSEEYPRRLEKMVTAAAHRGKAMFPGCGDPFAVGYAWVRSLVGATTSRPLWELNTLCSVHGYNPVFVSRFSILLPTKSTSGIRSSQTITTVQPALEPIDSS